MAKPASPRRDVDVATLHADLEASRVPALVDVRSLEEFSGGHVPGAVNVPLGEVAARLGELASYQSGEVYVICERGGRSSSAADQLVASGFRAVNVEGGTAAWRAAGYPLD